MRLFITASTLVLGLCAMQTPSYADHGKNFHCNFSSFVHSDAKAAISKIAGNNKGLRVVVQEYAIQWENDEIKRICDAAAAGQSANFSCLGGRQDWSAIKESIPPELLGLSSRDLRPHYLKLQKERAEKRTRVQVLNYCGTLGVVDRSFR